MAWLPGYLPDLLFAVAAKILFPLSAQARLLPMTDTATDELLASAGWPCNIREGADHILSKEHRHGDKASY
ncbi:unnamed protein product [Fusarium venenatum]|uniref:Uncharacterized protein n=1 Tax=Fusarium venenatum TaxID=56646 RepID=A0A2L2TUI1_9HYPO|nr:uncharacterized protein FVRRES_01592 [Fusarium venenatum]CEI65080.1 unnamed protein product [Fusarium venenatum]